MSTTMTDPSAVARAHPISEMGAPLILAQFSTRLPPELLNRLRVAAPQLSLRQSDIAARAIDEYLRRYGY